MFLHATCRTFLDGILLVEIRKARGSGGQVLLHFSSYGDESAPQKEKIAQNPDKRFRAVYH